MFGVSLGIIDSGGAGGGVAAYESIATVNGTGSSATITFSSIPSTYKHLQIRLMAACAYGSYSNTTVNVAFNNDTTSSNYAFHRLLGNSGAAEATGSTSNRELFRNSDTPSTTSVLGTAIVDIHDYASTTKNKTSRTFWGYDFGNLSSFGIVGLSSSLWLNTSAINSIALTAADGNWTSNSVFALYGIKG